MCEMMVRATKEKIRSAPFVEPVVIGKPVLLQRLSELIISGQHVAASRNTGLSIGRGSAKPLQSMFLISVLS